ncbi:MAG: hypothetical protein N2C14_09620 [Planctomycetales bacterium]
MFIHPMWQDEVQRIGKQRCTPTGFLLHGVSDLIGLLAIILLPAVPCYLIYTGIRGTFTWPSLWMLLLPFVAAIGGNMLHGYSWHLADVREFKYDYEKRTSTWRNRAGTIEAYTYEDSCKNDADTSSPADS